MEQQTNETLNNSNAGKGMGIAGLIVGILSLLFSFIPCLGMYAIVPAIVGIILSAVSMAQASKGGASKGMAIGGLVCAVVALLIAAYWIYAAYFVMNESKAFMKIGDELKNSGALDSLSKALEQIKVVTDSLNQNQ